MNKVKIYNQQGEAVGEQKLAPAVFFVPVNEGLVHQAVVAQFSRQRQVLAHTKTRAEVRGGGRKPWRQKGTGRARAGSSRSPIWIGGGITFGPRNDRNFEKKINNKMKQKALLMAFSDKLSHDLLAVVDDIKIADAKTKEAAGIIKNFTDKIFAKSDTKAATKNSRLSVLVVAAKPAVSLKRSFANLAGVSLLSSSNINIVDLLKYKYLILTAESVRQLEERYGKKD